MTKEELITTYNTLHWLREQLTNGNREGWGYSEEAINITIAHINNEIRLWEEK